MTDIQESNKTTTYMVSFGREGFEAIFDVTSALAEWTLAKMADKKPMPEHPSHVLQFLRIRAKANEQRFIEIWSFNSNLSYQEIVEMSIESPQVLADSIRDVGENLYMPRTTGKDVIV